MPRRAACLWLVLLAGCGGSSPLPADRRDRAVTGMVDLPRPAAGAPDAGTTAGHGNDGFVVATAARVVSFTGRVRPASSSVTVSRGDVRVEPSGRFTVATAVPRGGGDVSIEATHPGHRPWRTSVRAVRAAVARVSVPERDELAPSAALLLEPAGGGPQVVRASPSQAGEPVRRIRLARPAFRATATVRDAVGGTGRIRLAIETRTRCGQRVRPDIRLLPPAQVVSIALPPGAQAPVERSRGVHHRLDVPRDCKATGEVFAEGTDAAGRQAVTAHAGFHYRPTGG